MNIERFLKLVVVFVSFCCLVAASPATRAQQKETRGTLDVRCKSKYFLGETPTITIAITNSGRTPQTVRETSHQKFSFQATGIFEHDSGQQRKDAVYDGTWDLPTQSVKEPAPGEMREWLVPRKREPKLVQLSPGQSTELELNLATVFRSHLGVGKYQITVNPEDGQKVVKAFEVYFDAEKSGAIFAQYLKSNNDAERFWSVATFIKFDKPRLVALLEEVVSAGNESQREFAARALAQIRAGAFDRLKLRVGIKDRYSQGEKVVLAISIVNNSSTVQTVTKAEYHDIALQLTQVSGGDSKQAQTCTYDGGMKVSPETRATTRGVQLGELDATTLSLDLTDCLRSKLGVGEYQLSVTSANPTEALKDQTVIKTFAVY